MHSCRACLRFPHGRITCRCALIFPSPSTQVSTRAHYVIVPPPFNVPLVKAVPDKPTQRAGIGATQRHTRGGGWERDRG